ncbi:MAG: hypothetical protein WKF47_08380 [Geodermatophilaceae bacterium]
MGQSTEWGRIDDEGTVFVRTADGERPVGSWQAGDPADGLAHFCRRYDDLATEVELLEKRLASGAADPASTRSNATTLKEALPDAAVIGDLDGLSARLEGSSPPRTASWPRSRSVAPKPRQPLPPPGRSSRPKPRNLRTARSGRPLETGSGRSSTNGG